MKNNKKWIWLIAGLAVLILCIVLLLVTCGGPGGETPEPTGTEQATEATLEATAEATEPTEETEEATDPTEETEASSSGGSSSRPGGTSGFTGSTGGSTGSGSTGDSGSSGGTTTEQIEVDAPGTEGNPYAELFGKDLGTFTTVKMTSAQEICYKVYSVSGTVLTIESGDAYVVYDGQTYESQNGVVTVALAADAEDKPVSVKIGTRSAAQSTYDVSFSWPVGSVNNPGNLTVDQIPGSVVTGQIGPGESLYYNVSGVAGTRLTIADPNAWVICNGVTYKAENGVVTVDMPEGSTSAPILLAVGNGSAAAQAQTLSFDYIYGTPEHPYDLVMGEFTTVVAAGAERGVCYSYTAEATGVVTLRYLSGTAGVGCEYLLYNRNTYESRSLSADAVTDETTGITTVSIPVNEDDVLTLVVAALPGADGAYPAAQFQSLAAFTADGELPGDETQRVLYTVTVMDTTAVPASDVALTIKVGTVLLDLTTDAEGKAMINLPADTYAVTLEQPEGYTASETAFELTAGAPERTIVLTKNEEPETPDGTSLEYTVTVVDYNGVAQPSVVVQFLKDGTVVALGTTDASGAAKATLEQGSYSVGLAFSKAGYYYDESVAVFAADSTELQVRVATGLTGETEELYVGTSNVVYVGGTYVSGMQTNVVNYFLFTPPASGTYRFTTSNPEAVISYWGGTTSYIQDQTNSTDYADNAFTRNVKETNLGGVCIIGVTGASDFVLEITRTGDALLDETDIPFEVYEAKTPPTPFQLTLAAGQSLTYVDITGKTEDYQLVLGTDGYYHLGSATGPVMYVELGPNAPYVSFYQMLGYNGYGGTSFTQTFRDENGQVTVKEDYTACMCQYVEAIDPEGYGVYPMTEDLYYMLQEGGDFKGWWDSENPNFLFADMEGLNTDIAWMFCCCFVQ